MFPDYNWPLQSHTHLYGAQLPQPSDLAILAFCTYLNETTKLNTGDVIVALKNQPTSPGHFFVHSNVPCYMMRNSCQPSQTFVPQPELDIGCPARIQPVLWQIQGSATGIAESWLSLSHGSVAMSKPHSRCRWHLPCQRTPPGCN